MDIEKVTEALRNYEKVCSELKECREQLAAAQRELSILINILEVERGSKKAVVEWAEEKKKRWNNYHREYQRQRRARARSQNDGQGRPVPVV